MRTILAFLGTLCISVMASGQTDNIFAFYDSDNNSSIKITTVENGENNYLYVAGTNYETGSSYLIKIDENGNIIWQKLLAVSTTAFNIQYVQLKYYHDHIYVLGNITFPTSKSLLTKIDNSGVVIWHRELSSIDHYGYQNPSLEISPDNSLLVSSSTGTSIDIFSLNENGSTNWIKNFSTDSSEGKNPNFDICATTSGNIIGCAKAGSDISLYCLNIEGSLNWSHRLIESNSYTHVKSIIEIDQNKFLICGYRNPSMPSSPRAFYAMIDSLGSFMDFRYVNEMMEIKNAIKLSNGNILLCGVNGEINTYYLEILSNGDPVSGYYSLSEHATSYSYNATIEKNGSLYIGDLKNLKKLNDFEAFNCVTFQPITYTIGVEDPNTSPINHYFEFATPGIITDLASGPLNDGHLSVLIGCSEVMELDESTISNIKFYPTLLSNSESIIIQHEIKIPLQYQILDLNGKLIYSNNLVNNSVSINGLSTGMYVLRLISNESVVGMTKFVVTN